MHSINGKICVRIYRNARCHCYHIMYILFYSTKALLSTDVNNLEVLMNMLKLNVFYI